MKNLKTLIGMFLVLFLLVGTVHAKETLKMADGGWNTIQVHNRIAGFILEKGYGYDIKYIVGETVMLLISTVKGDIDIYIEYWPSNNRKVYEEYVKNKELYDLGCNFPDSWQGWLVPRYMVKGDTERNIEPVSPDLRSIEDMVKYWKLFEDPEVPNKGRFYSCIPGWDCQKVNKVKMKTYGLDKYYSLFLPGSGAALTASMVSAYKRGKPWFGYYWAPTWPLGVMDMMPIKEPPYNKKVWERNYGCAYPEDASKIAVNPSLLDHPDVVDFLKKYETDQRMNNKFLAYMQKNNTSTQEAALWFLRNYREHWHKWAPKNIVEKVENKL